jgi:hypothetical protein
MNVPSFKDILQKLSVFKNNVSLLVALIVAVVAGLLFIPTQLMSSGLKERIQQDSITNGARKIDQLSQSVVSPDQYQKEAQIQKAHAADANEVDLLAKETTQRDLLSYDIFPTPDPNAGFSAMIFQVFGQRYRSGIDKMIASVHARDCPAATEIQRGLDNAATSMRSVRSGPSMMEGYGDYGMGDSLMTNSPRTNAPMATSPLMNSPRGSAMNLYGGSMMGMGNVQRMIIDEMCLDRAKSTGVYVTPDQIAGYTYWKNYTYDVNMVDAVKDCWYNQLGYWVIEDIFDTIAKMNTGYDSVLTAPVKRFESLTFTMGLKRPRSGGGVFRGFRNRRSQAQKNKNADKPAYVLSAQDGLTESCTGRFSKPDGDIDVIHFNAAFVVDARDVLAFMKELCSGKKHEFRGYPRGQDPPQTFEHNQITVLESSMKMPTLTGPDHYYYRYGDGNVVELNLICEYIFNRKGYEAIKPESVKQTIAAGDQPTKKR